MTAEQIIKRLNLRPHELEGGYYYQTYVSNEIISVENLPKRYKENKPYSTAMYYLLAPETKSLLHRLPSDEIYHFYLGDPVQMLLLYPNGNTNIIFLGQDIMSGQRVQVTVPSGVWQGSFLMDGGSFALMGTTVSPGFDLGDFEHADGGELKKLYPQHLDLIDRLT